MVTKQATKKLAKGMTNKPIAVGNTETKWQELWYGKGVFNSEPDKKKPKWYMLFAYPTVSGTMHVGHARSYTLPDIVARYKRARGFNVFFPLGFHATGGDSQKIFDIAKSEPEKLAKYGIPPSKAKDFKQALDVTHYLQDGMIGAFKRLGLSLDFRPAISTIDPPYGKFIQWQFRKLKEAGYLVQRDHRLAWCPLENHPVSLDPAEADIQEWKGAQIKDYIIIKFTAGKLVLPAATMRPETIFGVTNVWIRPDGKYVEAEVDGERWLTSEESIKKLEDLGKKVKVIARKLGKEYVKLKVNNPATGKELPVLAGEFVDPSEATGVVMSVPSHDPFDFIYLRKVAPDIEPIQVVEIAGFGQAPAGDLLKKMGITDPKDPRIEEAVKELYKKEFGGRMRADIPKFGGMPVSRAKQDITKWLRESGKGDAIYEFSVKPIHCRDGTEIVIRAVKNQWFIDYGNEQLKEKSKLCVERMDIRPPEYKNELPSIIDWLEPRACVRRRGLGTEFPFEKGWVIEALSDSTIYMAFFIVSKWLNLGKIKESELTDAFFDYVFLGKGKPAGKTWQAIRDEFTYWYPLDINAAGKEHKQAHFPLFIANHVALFPEQMWPRGISVNWHLIVEGKKMSKHLGNVVFWDDAIKRLGADAVRFYLAHGANQWFDFDWRDAEAENYKRQLQALNDLLTQLTEKKGKPTTTDRWLASRLNHMLDLVTDALEKGEIRKAIDTAWFGFHNDLGWYMKRTDSYNMTDAISVWMRMLAPFIPHTAQEWWAKLGNNGMVWEAGWPAFDGTAVKMELEAGEELLKKVLGDIAEIKKISGIEKPSKITIIVSQPWKYKVYNEVLAGKKLKDIMQVKEWRELGQATVDYVNRLTKRGQLDELFLTAGSEFETLSEAKAFLEKETGAKVEVLQADRLLAGKKPVAAPAVPKKAESAEPSKPGILIA